MNQIDLNGQVAVVTGGAQGIGFAVAQRLVASGAEVSLWDLSAEMPTKAVADLGPAASAVQVDIIDYDVIAAAIAPVEAELSSPDILVNSAGVAGPNFTLDEFPLDEWRRVVEVNLNGTFYVNRAVEPGMKARNNGRIVNVSSVPDGSGLLPEGSLCVHHARTSRRKGHVLDQASRR